jgi:hypothetical protein
MFWNRSQSLHAFPDALLTITLSHLVLAMKCEVKLCIRNDMNIKTAQNYWIFLLFPSSGILENTTVRKLDLFPSSGEGGGEDTYWVGVSIQNWTEISSF